MVRYRSAGCLGACCLVVLAACAKEPSPPEITVTATVTKTPTAKTATPPAMRFPPKPAPDVEIVTLPDFVTPQREHHVHQ